MSLLSSVYVKCGVLLQLVKRHRKQQFCQTFVGKGIGNDVHFVYYHRFSMSSVSKNCSLNSASASALFSNILLGFTSYPMNILIIEYFNSRGKCEHWILSTSLHWLFVTNLRSLSQIFGGLIKYVYFCSIKTYKK